VQPFAAAYHAILSLFNWVAHTVRC
jgi:hypothetical protein